MKFYGIYKITNLVNGKMYIGQHTTTNLDDGYMGSGLVIRRAIEKYGIENFRKEWIMFCEDRDELNYWERVFVDDTWVLRSDTYNLKVGGKGGSVQGRPAHNKGKPLSEAQKLKISEARKHLSEETRRKLGNGNRGRRFSDEVRKRMSEGHRGLHPT